MKRMLPIWFVLQITLMGCINKTHPACEWSAPAPRRLDLTRLLDRQRLAHNGHTAEDAAIRYADSLAHNRFEYTRFRTECMNVLFSKVAEVNGVTLDEAHKSLDIRPLGFDVIVELSFVALYYWFVGRHVARRIHWLYRESFSNALLLIAFASIIVSALAVLIGEFWTGALETIRIGNGHISYRIERIPWQHHRLEIVILGMVLFWMVTGLEYRSDFSEGSGHASAENS
jgi:hypothetical protein